MSQDKHENRNQSRSDLYCDLPDSVAAVKDRIKFNHYSRRVNKPRAERFIAQSAPVFSTEGYGLKYYFLDDVRKNIKKNVKKKKNAKVDKLNSKQRKLLFTVTKESNLKYETFVKVNSIWNDYIGTILKNSPKDALLRLAKADYHGAKLCVLASINPSLVGITGFVVQETKNTFKLIDKDNQIRIIPKNGTLFTFGHGGVIYKLNGSQLKITSHQRSKIKFKSKKVPFNI